MADRRYTMGKPFWRQLLDSPRFMRAAFGMVLTLWIILRMIGVLDVWDLLTMMLVLFSLSWANDFGLRSPIPWLVVGAGVLVQVSHLGDFTAGVQAGIWLAFVIVAIGALWQDGTIRTRRTVRLRGGRTATWI